MCSVRVVLFVSCLLAVWIHVPVSFIALVGVICIYPSVALTCIVFMKTYSVCIFMLRDRVIQGILFRYDCLSKRLFLCVYTSICPQTLILSKTFDLELSPHFLFSLLFKTLIAQALELDL